MEGQPLFVNAFFCAMLGFSEEEMRTKHCVDFSPPEDAEKDWELFQQLKTGVNQSLSDRQALHPTRRLIGVGTFKHLFVESNPTSGHRDGGRHYREDDGGRSAVTACRHRGIV